MIDAQTLARQAGFSKFHQRQLRHLIALNKLDQYDDLKPINQTAEGCAEPGARCYGG